MAKLYELRNDYEKLLNDFDNYIDENGEINPQYFELLNKLEDDLRTKAIGVAEFVKRLESDVNAYATEIARLTALKKRALTKIDFYKKYLSSAMQGANIERIDDVKATISFTSSERVVIDTNAVIPKKFTIQTFTPDKKAIKGAIAQGKKFKGVRIEKSKNIQIK